MLGDDSLGDTGGQGKHKLIDNEVGAWHGKEQMEQAKRSALAAEKVSLEVMRELHGHSQKMQEIKVKVTDMNENIDGSSNIIARMMKLENKNKVLIIGATIILVLVLFFVILYKVL